MRLVGGALQWFAAGHGGCSSHPMGRYLGAWIPMVFIAVGNGVLREAWLSQRFGELRGRQISTLLLIALFAVYVRIIVRIWPIESGRQAATIGLAWLGLTLGFELALGRFVSGLSWREIAAEYNVATGRLWILVPVWVAIAPYIFFRTQKWRIGT